MMISIKIGERETAIDSTDKCSECSCTLRHKISIIHAKKKKMICLTNFERRRNPGFSIYVLF